MSICLFVCLFVSSFDASAADHLTSTWPHLSWCDVQRLASWLVIGAGAMVVGYVDSDDTRGFLLGLGTPGSTSPRSSDSQSTPLSQDTAGSSLELWYKSASRTLQPQGRPPIRSVISIALCREVRPRGLASAQRQIFSSRGLGLEHMASAAASCVLPRPRVERGQGRGPTT